MSAQQSSQFADVPAPALRSASGNARPELDAILTLLAKPSDFVSVLDTGLKIVWASPSVDFLPRDGAPPSALDYIHPDDVPRVAEVFRQVLSAPERVETVTYRAIGPGGTMPDVESVFRNCLDNPAIRGVLVNTRDVTEQMREERELRRSERGLQAILQELPLGVAICQDDRIVLVNWALESMTGCTRHELLGLGPSELFADEDRERGLSVLDGSAGREPLHDLKLLRKDGESVETEFSASNIGLDGVPATLLVFSDVSERRALRARLVFADRMVSVGTLAAGVAHEVNNPLAFMTMNLAFIEEELLRVVKERELGDELAEVLNALRDARSGCARVRSVVRDLRTFSRADQESRTKVDILQILETCLSMTRNELRHRARLETSLDQVPALLANHAQLAQVFLNLLLNAAQAIKEGDATHNEIRITLRQVEGLIVVAIRDSGAGIPADVVPRIFDPFFTTKPVGTGVGLGLTLCHNIVTGLGGTIQVETAEGLGSTFTIRLPAGGLPATIPPQSATSSPARTTLLIVDDDSSIGLSLARALRDGHDVSYVEDGRRALDLLRSGQRFDAILCDLLMPNLAGSDLYDVLLSEIPDQARRMIFMTAGAFTPGAAEFFQTRARWKLEKPFGVDQVESCIATMRAGLDGFPEQ